MNDPQSPTPSPLSTTTALTCLSRWPSHGWNTPGELPPQDLCSYCHSVSGPLASDVHMAYSPSTFRFTHLALSQGGHPSHSLQTPLLPHLSILLHGLFSLRFIYHFLSYLAVNWWSSEKLNNNRHYDPSLHSFLVPGTLISCRVSLILTPFWVRNFQGPAQENMGTPYSIKVQE